MISQIRKWQQALTSDEQGISAVEFALILPVLIALYLGGVELTLAMTLDRKVTGATAALGDLTARASHLDNDDLADIFEATRMVMQPNDIALASMQITSVSYDSSVHTTSGNNVQVNVDWSDTCGSQIPPLVDDTEIEVPKDLIPDGGTLIVAKISFPYDSPVGFFFSSTRHLTDTFYLRPRRVDSITRDDATGTLSCGF
jgi:Flp pilus assembly pilin Flp